METQVGTESITSVGVGQFLILKWSIITSLTIIVYSVILGYSVNTYTYGHYKVCVNVNNNYMVSMLCSWLILCRHFVINFDAKADKVNINIYFAFSVYYIAF